MGRIHSFYKATASDELEGNCSSCDTNPSLKFKTNMTGFLFTDVKAGLDYELNISKMGVAELILGYRFAEYTSSSLADASFSDDDNESNYQHTFEDAGFQGPFLSFIVHFL